MEKFFLFRIVFPPFVSYSPLSLSLFLAREPIDIRMKMNEFYRYFIIIEKIMDGFEDV